MLLTLSTTHQPATDLGFLLSKHPDKCQSFSLAYGKAHVFYPEATTQRCTAALLLDFDPVGLVRGRQRNQDTRSTLAHYVNDRPYVASSFLSVAIAQVLGSALKGTSRERPVLAESKIPLTATLSAVPSRGGEQFLRSLFEPLGYAVDARRIPLDEEFPQWGSGNIFKLSLSATLKLSEMLSHLYVLIPVLDNQKHYWVGEEEVDKLLDKAGEWLKTHPAREEITRRYLKHRRSLYRDALERLLADDGELEEENQDSESRSETSLERPLSLNEQRMKTVVAELKSLGATRVLDLGCGEGRLIQALLKESGVSKVVGVDVSMRSLEIAAERLKLDQMGDAKRKRVDLFQSSLTYRDSRFSEFDAACAIEVIEHIDPSRLTAFERVVFEFARPTSVILTTPNVEYNANFETLPSGTFRHRDHRFEWTRSEFEEWANAVASRHGYSVRFTGIGPEDPERGTPTQMGVFQR